MIVFIYCLSGIAVINSICPGLQAGNPFRTRWPMVTSPGLQQSIRFVRDCRQVTHSEPGGQW